MAIRSAVKQRRVCRCVKVENLTKMGRHSRVRFDWGRGDLTGDLTGVVPDDGHTISPQHRDSGQAHVIAFCRYWWWSWSWSCCG